MTYHVTMHFTNNVTIIDFCLQNWSCIRNSILLKNYLQHWNFYFLFLLKLLHWETEFYKEQPQPFKELLIDCEMWHACYCFWVVVHQEDWKSQRYRKWGNIPHHSYWLFFFFFFLLKMARVNTNGIFYSAKLMSPC